MINLIMGLVELLTSWIIADVLISCIVLYLPFQIIYSFIYYNLFKKIGISKWKAIIPIERTIELLKSLKISFSYYIGACVSLVVSFISWAHYWGTNMGTLGGLPGPGKTVNTILNLLFFFSLVIGIVLFVIGKMKKVYRLSKTFKKSKWFMVGLFFLELLFLPFISFSKDAFDESDLM